MNNNLDIDKKLAGKLSVLRDQPSRDSNMAVLGRAAFLDQAREMAITVKPAVSENKNMRHNKWMHAIQTILLPKNKERSPMFGTLGTVMLILSLVFGGGGATVVAAQSSLPNQVLYPVKTWSENVRSEFTQNEQTRLELELDFANRRAEEMVMMLKAGQVPPQTVQTRMQAEIEFALQLAAGKPDSEMVPALIQIREQLQAQEQLFLQVGAGANSQGEALLIQSRTMLQEQLRLCEEGLRDPQALREQLQAQKQDHGQQTTPMANPTENGKPWTTGTPAPGSSYGPGPGDGEGDNPWTDTTPTPGSSYGPGPKPENGGEGDKGSNGGDTNPNNGNEGEDTGSPDNGGDKGGDNGGDNSGDNDGDNGGDSGGDSGGSDGGNGGGGGGGGGGH